MRKKFFLLSAFCCLVSTSKPLQASTGTQGASFLDIPVGAGPAAMGSAYTALATDAYAPTWNPAGLGFLDSYQFAAQHLSYVQDTHDEYFSFGVPLPRPKSCTIDWLCGDSAVGGSIQYFGSGDIQGLDTQGNPTGDYSSHYAAYNASYGRTFTDKLSFGITTKLINAELADVSANAFAVDMGSFYRWQNNIQFAATLMNIGSDLTFLSDGDSLPTAFHVAGAWQPLPPWNLSLETVFAGEGTASVRMGAEWLPLPEFSWRVGYKTDTLSGLSPLAGFTTGIGLHFWGQEFSYAWVPLGDLGDSQYFSLVCKFGEAESEKRNLIHYHSASSAARESNSMPPQKAPPNYEVLQQLLNENDPSLPDKK